MTKREQKLALAVGSLVALLVGGYLVSLVRSAFESRRETLDSVASDVRRTKLTITRGERAKQQRAEFRQRSLPADVALARSVYQTWLIKTAETSGLSDVSVTPSTVGTQRNVYSRHRFSLAARGNLEQTTRFLYDFASAGHLHRIETLMLKPLQDSRELDIRFTADALSLVDATDRRELTKLPGDRLAHSDVKEYIDKIVRRNVYGPANLPPRFSGEIVQTAAPNKPLTFNIRASDPDKLDKVSYELGEHSLEGLQLDPQTGEVKWTPGELGEFVFAVTAIDNGFPPKSSSTNVRIRVAEPPPPPPPPPRPKPSYEIAKMSIISAVNSVNGRPEIWVNVRPEGRILKVRVGDALEVGEFKAIVKSIAGQEAEIEVDGATQRVLLGQPLVPNEG